MFASVLRTSTPSIKYKVFTYCFNKMTILVSYSSGTEQAEEETVEDTVVEETVETLALHLGACLPG